MSAAEKFRLLIVVGLLLSSWLAACASPPPELSVEEATAVIMQRFPSIQPNHTSVRMEDGQGVLECEFNGAPATFRLAPTEAGWKLETVELEGITYAVDDLETISETMSGLGKLAEALEKYKAGNGAYPVGVSSQSLQVLLPDYLPVGSRFTDGWEHELSYSSQNGEDYTLISWGPDEKAGSEDDIILVSGAFLGAGR
ncbi:MAG: type II secretion system protein GspG [Acidobacteriota bacterium]